MHKEVISDPGNEMQFFAHQIAFLLTYRAVQKSVFQAHGLSEDKAMCCLLWDREGSQPWPLSGHDAASLWTALPPEPRELPVSEDMLSLLAKCSQSEVSRCLIWYFLKPCAKYHYNS